MLNKYLDKKTRRRRLLSSGRPIAEGHVTTETYPQWTGVIYKNGLTPVGVGINRKEWNWNVGHEIIEILSISPSYCQSDDWGGRRATSYFQAQGVGSNNLKLILPASSNTASYTLTQATGNSINQNGITIRFLYYDD